MSDDGFLAADELGARIESLRLDAELTIDDLAQKTSIEAGELSAIEAGDQSVAVSDLVSIAAALAVDTEEILLRDPHPVPLFRNEGGAEEARAAQIEMEGIMDDYLSFKSVVGG